MENTTKIYRIILLGIILIGLTVNLIAQDKHDWLEDQPPTDKVTRVQTNKFTNLTGFPRRSTGTLKGNATAEQLACFDIVCKKPFNQTAIFDAQRLNPNLTWLRECSPQAYQGFADAAGSEVSGFPFTSSGSVTTGPSVFAGHWAYQPYTTLSAGITAASGITLTVSDASKIQSGVYYYVIRPSATDWTDAEHVYLTKSGSTITLTTRGYKSTAKVWPAGSVIAQHTTGNGTAKELWVYNHSTKCPVDGNGKKLHEALSTWMAAHYDKDGSGNPDVAQIGGILYDADPISYVDGGGINDRDADLDNDGFSDWGFAADGTNFWGEGLELYYKGVRDGIDARGHTNVVILSGAAESYGVLPNNGTQLEAAWSHTFSEDGAIAGANSYGFVPFYLSEMKAQTGHGTIGPRVTDVQSKEASVIYHGTAIPANNNAVRFSYSMSMMFDGAWFSNQNGFGGGFHYFDEDAVYTTPGENYGKSVLRTNTTDIRANNKWLGNAKGQYQRIYDAATFEANKNLISNGNFESAVSGWTPNAATVSQITDKKYEGSSSLLIAPTKPNSNLQISGSAVTSPAVSLTSNQEYTLCFAAYTEGPSRIIRVSMGSLSSKLLLTPGWSKHVLGWKQGTAVSIGLKFEVGAELTNVWIDQLCLFSGTADVFRRDFDNGIIIANASSSSQTIALNGTFQRIKGNLDAATNNGQTITEITLPAHDGIFLVRPSGTTGTSEMIDSQPKVFPNPFTNNFSLEIPDGINSIEIYSSSGAPVFKQEVKNKKILRIEKFETHPSGIYFAKFSGTIEPKVVKIIKK
jgi:hypothetical protein